MRINKKSLPDTLAYLESIIETIHEAIVILDADLRVSEASASFYQKFEVNAEDTEGKYIYELGNHQWDIPKLRELLEKTIPQNERVENFEVTHDFEHIGKRTMLLNARRFHCQDDGESENHMILLAIHDVTDLKNMQNRLETTVDELRTRNEELDAFAHTVAHDLKNPISSMIGFASLIKKYRTQMSDDELTDNLDAIIESGEHIKSIINSLMLLANVDRSKNADIVPLDMHTIVEEVKQTLRTMIRDYNAEIDLPESWGVPMGYAPWVQAVWTNYITNAIKYGGDPPVLTLGWDECDDGMLHFWVQDNGKGLTEDEQGEIFQPFTRLSSDIEGHGLGLSVVQKIMDKLNGEVTLDSTPGKGSRFGFKLPAFDDTTA